MSSSNLWRYFLRSRSVLKGTLRYVKRNCLTNKYQSIPRWRTRVGCATIDIFITYIFPRFLNTKSMAFNAGPVISVVAKAISTMMVKISLVRIPKS